MNGGIPNFWDNLARLNTHNIKRNGVHNFSKKKKLFKKKLIFI